jgi:hypothetical protein
MDYLLENVDWLVNKIKNFKNTLETSGEDAENSTPYLLFDLPGQVELYTHFTSVKSVIYKLRKLLKLEVVCVHLMDSSVTLEPLAEGETTATSCY